MPRNQAVHDGARAHMEAMAQNLLAQVNRAPRQSRSMQAGASAILDNLRGNRDHGDDLTDATLAAMEAVNIAAADEGGIRNQVSAAERRVSNLIVTDPQLCARSMRKAFLDGVLSAADINDICDKVEGGLHPDLLSVRDFANLCERGQAMHMEALREALRSEPRQRQTAAQQRPSDAVLMSGLNAVSREEIVETLLRMANPAAVMLPDDYADNMQAILPQPPEQPGEPKQTNLEPTKSMIAVSGTQKRKILKLKR